SPPRIHRSSIAARSRCRRHGIPNSPETTLRTRWWPCRWRSRCSWRTVGGTPRGAAIDDDKYVSSLRRPSVVFDTRHCAPDVCFTVDDVAPIDHNGRDLGNAQAPGINHALVRLHKAFL